MKKQAKSKKTKRRAAAKDELPDLVAVMMKVAERLEALERKTDLMIGRISNLPSEMRRSPQPAQRTEPVQQAGQNPQQNHGPRERVLYQAVCADCCKNCEVPFKPGKDRPVYCKECFVKRKAGHVPQDPDKPSTAPRLLPAQPPMEAPEAPPKRGKTSKKKKHKPAKRSKK